MKRLALEDKIIKEDMECIYMAGTQWSRLNNASVLVTGCSGMIASYYVLFLIYLVEIKKLSITIYAEVRRKEKLQERLGFYCLQDYFHILECDICDLAKTNIKPDYIVHAASLASPQYYGKYPVETMLPNVVGTTILLDIAVKSKSKGFLFFSSGSVYGSVENVDVLSESMAGPFQYLAPGNVYGESKRCGEALCMAYFREYEVPIRIARIHHTYGPTMDYLNDERVFSTFVRNIIRKEDIIMKSDGTAKRAFCYIADMVGGLLRIMIEGKSGEVYNLANEHEYISIRELAELLSSLYPEKGIKVVISKQENKDYCSSNEKRIIPIDCTKAEQLGWKPSVNISNGFRRTIDYLED